MVVHVRFFGVVRHFVVQTVLMPMAQQRMGVLVRMPGGAVVPSTVHAVRVLVRNVVVVVLVHECGMGVRWLMAVTVNALGVRGAAPRTTGIVLFVVRSLLQGVLLPMG
jgi:hypothetical protein